jgi:hypothetical protein
LWLDRLSRDFCVTVMLGSLSIGCVLGLVVCRQWLLECM